MREECVDKILIVNEGHLQRVLTAYVDYDNRTRPQQGINQQCPIPLGAAPQAGPIERRDILGGVLQD